MNLLSSTGHVVGGLIGYFSLQAASQWEPVLLAWSRRA